MTQKELATALGGYFAAMGIESERSAYCIPFLTGARAVPGEVGTVSDNLTEQAKKARLLTFPEAARILGCSRHTIWRMTKSSELPPVNWHGKNKVRLSDVLALGLGEVKEEA